MGRSHLAGEHGDAINAVLATAGDNVSPLINRFSDSFCRCCSSVRKPVPFSLCHCSRSTRYSVQKITAPFGRREEFVIFEAQYWVAPTDVSSRDKPR